MELHFMNKESCPMNILNSHVKLMFWSLNNLLISSSDPVTVIHRNIDLIIKHKDVGQNFGIHTYQILAIPENWRHMKAEVVKEPTTSNPIKL
jgi:hypothetical protein